jgi:hypothetical protein
MKHVGKMKNNGAKVVVTYRTLPGDHQNALVIGTGSLGPSYHDSLMNLIQDDSAQQANELADILAVRKFPDGNNMLQWLHVNGFLKKVPTNLVLMTPNSNVSVPLDELNQLIASQRGVSVEELAINDGSIDVKSASKSSTTTKTDESVDVESLTPSQLRSRADALFKEAQVLRKKADTLDPPKRRKKTAVEVE